MVFLDVSDHVIFLQALVAVAYWLTPLLYMHSEISALFYFLELVEPKAPLFAMATEGRYTNT